MSTFTSKVKLPQGSFSTTFVRADPNDQFTLVRQNITFSTEDFSITEQELMTGPMPEIMLAMAVPLAQTTKKADVVKVPC